ncbi:hypothetical protein Zm00014a_001928 [Zea mays]|uniref:Pectin lyase-like superfamily protein n=1 Tax=Zea mays TaxID=4577 RepID=A0A3L6FJ58_MAIZE|nr:hypothetical protein Zm00014a_001928 [Zea mays]
MPVSGHLASPLHARPRARPIWAGARDTLTRRPEGPPGLETPTQGTTISSEDPISLTSSSQAKMERSTGRGRYGGTSSTPRSSSSSAATSSSSSTLTTSSSPMSPSSTRRTGTSTLPIAPVNLTCHATVLRSNVTISGVRILAPVNSPNTNGIDLESSSRVNIEDC